LITLIEHGIVYFSEPADDKKDPTYYEIDTQKIMMRLRMGRIMRVTEEHYGKAVSNSLSRVYKL
jgi:DNA-directed RNA polymerase III subunit RPC3